MSSGIKVNDDWLFVDNLSHCCTQADLAPGVNVTTG